MLNLTDIQYEIGDKKLLREINWTIRARKRIALIGPNGAGKTTLLRVLAGELTATKGTIVKPRDYKIGYLPQEEIAAGRGPVLLEVLSGHTEIMDMEARISDLHAQLDDENLSPAEQAKLMEQAGILEDRFQMAGGYELESQAKKILAGLGFQNDEFMRPLSEFSGGWRMRVFLARLLLQTPDLLLLDEPTNHLDIESLEWLEDYLLDFKGSIILVSHDRFFIDRLSQEIAELERGQLTYYSGNYHFYEKQKALHHEQLLKKYEEIREEKARLQRFIDRFRYKNTKAPQVQSRVKRLEKLEEVEIPPATKSISFSIRASMKSYHHVCHTENLSFSYDTHLVLNRINFDIYRGQKIAMVGVNGAGKTTLTRLLSSELKPTIGKIELGERVESGYYAQHQVEALHLQNTVLQEVEACAAAEFRTRLRDILGVFRFTGDDVDKKIAVLSGGEKARVSLAKILLSPVNFLIMDEPTNHLDLASKEALEKALKNYDGTVLLISHDRYFLDKLVTRVFELDGGKLTQYEGNYSDYLRLKKLREKDTSRTVEKTKATVEDKTSAGYKSKEQKRLEALERQKISGKRKKIDKRIAVLEKEIESLENEKAELEREMAEPEFFKDEQAAKEKTQRYKELQDLLPLKMEEWESAGVELDSLLATIRN